jgi:hypothetical protein
MTPILITLLVTLPIIGFGTWLYLCRRALVLRVCTVRSTFATVLSLACGIPCSLMTLCALWLCFVVKHSEQAFEAVMALYWLSPWISPLAIAALVFAAFARKCRRLCLAISVVYFVGWAAIYLFA